LRYQVPLWPIWRFHRTAGCCSSAGCTGHRWPNMSGSIQAGSGQSAAHPKKHHTKFRLVDGKGKRFGVHRLKHNVNPKVVLHLPLQELSNGLVTSGVSILKPYLWQAAYIAIASFRQQLSGFDRVKSILAAERGVESWHSRRYPTSSRPARTALTLSTNAFLSTAVAIACRTLRLSKGGAFKLYLKAYVTRDALCTIPGSTRGQRELPFGTRGTGAMSNSLFL